MSELVEHGLVDGNLDKPDLETEQTWYCRMKDCQLI